MLTMKHYVLFFKIVISLFLLSVHCIVKAQNVISGFVIDNNDEVLHLANIVALNKEGQFISGTTSSENGFFSFSTGRNTNNIYQLITTYVGMKPDTFVVENNSLSNITIKLLPNTALLNGIDVYGFKKIYKHEEDKITANVAGTILSKSGMFDDLMRQIPFVSGQKGDYNVFGRGKAIIFINNRRLYDPAELNMYSSDKIKRIEVITNPGIKYKSDIKAVIKIFTNDSQEGLGGNAMAYLQYGRKFSNFENMSLVYNVGRLQLQGSLSYSNTQMKQNVTDETEINGSRKSLNRDDVTIDYSGDNISTNFGLDYSITNKNSIGLYSKLGMAKLDNGITLHSVEHITENLVDFKSQADAFSRYKPSQWITGLYFTATTGKTNFEITNDFVLGRQRKLFSYAEMTYTDVNTNGVMKYLLNSTIINLNTSFSKTVGLNYGGEMTYSTDKQSFEYDEKNISSGLVASKTQRRQWLFAGYAGLQINSKKWKINTGIRYEYTPLDYYSNEQKSKDLSRAYNNFFPQLNVSFSPFRLMNISLGYRMSIKRPSYSSLNDNIQYNNRFAYVQGNSELQPEYTHSINYLASYGNIRLIASYDWIHNAFMSTKSIYGTNGDIVLSRIENMPNFTRLSVGANWWDKFGFYTPYLELNITKQFFKYEYLGDVHTFNKPTLSFKFHHTFSLPKGFTCMAFLDFNGNRYDMFRKRTHQWSSQFSISKGFAKGWFLQLNGTNLFCSGKSSSITYCSWIKDSTINDNDYQNVSLLISYNFNAKHVKHNNSAKSSEIKRY